MISDTPNLTILLRKSKSPLLIALLKEQIADIPNIDELDCSTLSGCSNALARIPAHDLKKLNLWAETINVMSDKSGQQAISSIKHLFDRSIRNVFYKSGNQYDRTLWLYKHHRKLFDDALNARFEVESKTLIAFSSFQAEPNLRIIVNEDANNIFCNLLKNIIDYTSIYIDINTRQYPTPSGREKTDIYLIKVYYSNTPEAVDCIDDGRLSITNILQTHHFIITYDALTGITNIQFENFSDRQTVFLLFSRFLLDSNSEYETPIEYKYQKLSRPLLLDINNEKIKKAAVTSLRFDGKGGNICLENTIESQQDIYSIATYSFGAEFKTENFHLSGVGISMILREDKKTKWPERAAHITLKNKYSCVIQAAFSDQFECIRLLQQWEVL